MKRMIAVLLATLMLTGILTACSGTVGMGDGQAYGNVSTTPNGRVNGGDNAGGMTGNYNAGGMTGNYNRGTTGNNGRGMTGMTGNGGMFGGSENSGTGMTGSR